MTADQKLMCNNISIHPDILVPSWMQVPVIKNFICKPLIGNASNSDQYGLHIQIMIGDYHIASQALPWKTLHFDRSTYVFHVMLPLNSKYFPKQH